MLACSTRARAGATTSFVQRGIGDVLIAWENEAFLSLKEFGPDKFEIVVPSVSILAEPPVAVVDSVVDRHGTRKQAEAYLNFLYSEEGQEIAARNFYRPRSDKVPAALTAKFPKLKLYNRRRFVRRVGKCAEDALRGRRRLRFDLSATIGPRQPATAVTKAVTENRWCPASAPLGALFWLTGRTRLQSMKEHLA